MPSFVVEPTRIPGYNKVRWVGLPAMNTVDITPGESHFAAAVFFGLTAVAPFWAGLAFWIWR